MTLDRWHVTLEISHMKLDVGWKSSQSLGSLAFRVWDLWCSEDLEEMNNNELMTKVFSEQSSLWYTGDMIQIYSIIMRN